MWMFVSVTWGLAHCLCFLFIVFRNTITSHSSSINLSCKCKPLVRILEAFTSAVVRLSCMPLHHYWLLCMRSTLPLDRQAWSTIGASQLYPCSLISLLQAILSQLAR